MKGNSSVIQCISSKNSYLFVAFLLTISLWRYSCKKCRQWNSKQENQNW